MNSTVDEEVHEHLPMDFLSSIPNRLSDFFGKGWSKNFLVEHTGLEPVASTLPVWRAPSCANAPLGTVYHTYSKKNNEKFYFLSTSLNAK